MKFGFTFLLMFLLGMAGLQAQHDQLPTDPEPGKCYVKCVTPDEFETVQEQILVRPAYTRLEVIPAEYETVTERVLVKEESKDFVFHAAVYETVEVPYMQKEARTDLTTVEATFTPDQESRIIYPKTSGWEYTTYADCASANPNDCQILCWNEYPEQTQVVPVQRLNVGAHTEDIPIREINATYTKQVIKTPARVEERVIPAEYSEITKQVLKAAATTRTIEIPAEYKTISKTVLKKKGGVTVWEEIDCKLTEANILPILWDFNSAALTSDAKRIIDDKLLSLMQERSNITVELSSHTDSRGNDDYNERLSQRRADAVVNYLINKGINRSRLISKGYGEDRLKNHCGNGVECTEEQHQKNRRTEFRVVGGN